MVSWSNPECRGGFYGRLFAPCALHLRVPVHNQPHCAGSKYESGLCGKVRAATRWCSHKLTLTRTHTCTRLACALALINSSTFAGSYTLALSGVVMYTQMLYVILIPIVDARHSLLDASRCHAADARALHVAAKLLALGTEQSQN
jgi:hypothetical protein